MPAIPGGITGVRRQGVGEQPSRSILVVDDEPHFVWAVRLVLENQGFVVFGAESAMQAMRMLETIKPDLMLVDIMMPEIDGLTMIREISSELTWHDARMVVVSALSEEPNKEAAREAGAHAYLPKPFTSETLLNVVDNLLPKAA
jgi:DNA-binding response OmpR family regulator